MIFFCKWLCVSIINRILAVTYTRLDQIGFKKQMEHYSSEYEQKTNVVL